MPAADEAGEEASLGGPPAERTSGPATVTREQLERVIRRASDLQFRGSAAADGDVGAGEVVQIGAEVGLEERYVRQALAEVRAESLIPEAPLDDGLLLRLCGPGSVSASRVVPGGPAEVEANLEAYLRDEELLRQVRSRRGGALWEPGTGLVSQMRRSLDVSGRRYMIAKARNLQVTSQALESGWSLVTLTADLRNLRGERLGGWFAGLALGGGAAGVGLYAATGGGVLPVLGGIAILAGSVAIASISVRANMRKVRQRMELALQGLLDRLERGENLRAPEEPWYRKLLGS